MRQQQCAIRQIELPNYMADGNYGQAIAHRLKLPNQNRWDKTVGNALHCHMECQP